MPDHPLPEVTPPATARAAVLRHRDRALEGLKWEEDEANDLVLFVTTPAVAASGQIDLYMVKLGFAYYPDWPPSATFVDPATRQYSPRHWPVIENSDRMALHPTYGDAPEGLICNSMFFEFYFWGGHGRNPQLTWEKGRHTMAASISELKIHLQPPYYQRRNQ